jgi:ABC-type phosphate transport system substrate-binding protein
VDGKSDVTEVSKSLPQIRDRLRRLCALALAIFSLLTLGSFATAGTASAEPAPRSPVTASGTGGRSATVSPGVELSNEVVNVSWSGFRPTTQQNVYTVIVMQCKANPVSLDDCFSAEPFPNLTNGNRLLDFTAADGTGSAQFEVRPASNLPQLACSATNPCSILVYENDALPIQAGGLPSARVVIPISFALSQADCPDITDFDVRADGSATSASLFYSWAARICQGDASVVVDYTETSSTTGRENFLSGLIDFGVTALPASEEELSNHPDHREYSYAPVAASAVVVAYNLTDPYTGLRVENLVLSPRLVARLVTNTSMEKFLNDRELLNINPTVLFPTNGVNPILVRAERSAATTILTSWMSADPEAQKFLADTDRWKVRLNPAYVGYSYPRDSFELVDTDPRYLPRQGQKNIATRMFYGVSPTGTQAELTSARGVIGIIDLPTAKRFGLQVAGLLKPDGTVVRVTDDSILRGIADADVSAAGTLVADPTPEDPLAYPMIKVDYAMVPKTFDTEKKIADVRRVLSYAVGDGQNYLPSGFVTLPDAMRAEALKIVESIGVSETVATTTTTTTTSTTTSTTTPSTTTMPVIEVVPVPTTSRPRVATPATTVAPSTTTTTSTTTPSSTTSTTTQLPPITVPKPQLSDELASAQTSSGLLLGLGGLSGAAILGTAPWRKLSIRRKKVVS